MKRATHTFAIDSTVVYPGAEYADDDPIVVGREELFEDVAAENAGAPAENTTPVIVGMPADGAAKKAWEAFAATYDPPLDVDKSLKADEYKAAVKSAAIAYIDAAKAEAAAGAPAENTTSED